MESENRCSNCDFSCNRLFLLAANIELGYVKISSIEDYDLRRPAQALDRVQRHVKESRKELYKDLARLGCQLTQPEVDENVLMLKAELSG